METCDQCMGSGYGGHPDNGQTCYRCGGSGGVTDMADSIRADREAGTPGPWMAAELEEALCSYEDWPEVNIEANDDCGTHSLAHVRYGCSEAKVEGDVYANARRIARLPDLEEAYLAILSENAALREQVSKADELADASMLEWDARSKWEDTPTRS